MQVLNEVIFVSILKYMEKLHCYVIASKDKTSKERFQRHSHQNFSKVI